MKKINPFRVFSGGQATRAEMYGLFIAAIVIIGGGVSGAIALTGSDTPVNLVTPTQTAAPSETSASDGSAASSTTETEAQTQTDASGETAPGSSQTPSGTDAGTSSGTSPVACEYTPAEQDYYNSIRATKQASVDQAQAHVDNVHSWITSNTAHLEELLAAPYRPIEVFQWKPDGTPYVWRVDSNEEIAQERQRIVDNEAELVRAEAALQQAIADRDLIPGCN